MKPNQALAAASFAPLGTKKSFAATQAAWRFYSHEAVTLTKLAQPLVEASCEGVATYCDNYALIVHDWSGLNYTGHESKKDKKVLHNRYEQGYELQSSLMVSDRNGLPFGVLTQNVVSSEGVWSSYQGDAVQIETEHLQELAQRVQWQAQQALGKPQVHIVDREGDAVEWLRACPNSLWLIRCRQNSTVSYEGQSYQVQHLAKSLEFAKTMLMIDFKGKKAYQTVAEVAVTLTRDAKPKRKIDGKPQIIKGAALSARLIVSRIEDEQGQCLASWYLLSNVADVQAQTLACWYYWRWKIECFFKLLKQQGLQLENWQQETALAIAKRLLVATQACILVWQLQQQESPEAQAFKYFLVRLSGRQMKKKSPITTSALFEGIWIFLTAMDIFERYSLDELAEFKRSASSFWESSVV